MLHPVQGVLCIEGVQTGDGRIWVPGALTVAPLPLPLAWIDGGDQHVDLVNDAPTIGNITAVIRQGGVLLWVGVVDDDVPEGAEAVRRMQAGSASHGTRMGISIDGDNWAAEVVLTDADEAEFYLYASGEEGDGLPSRSRMRTMVAAAGDGDPGGMVLFADSVDELLWRFTRTRIRGATCCAVPAFAECYMELAPEQEAITASLATERPEPPFPAAWFEDPQLGPDDPGEVTADGQVRVRVALFDSCHIGYEDRCVRPPRSETDYAHAHTRLPLPLDDGTNIRLGSITVATGHASLRSDMASTVAHYDNTGACAALVRFGEDEHGIWAAGVVNPTATDEQIWALRSSAVSGDWRYWADFRETDGNLEMVAVLSVNVRGFGVPDSMAASGEDGRCVSLLVSSPRWSTRSLAIHARRKSLDLAETAAASGTAGVDRARVAAARMAVEVQRAAVRR